MSKTIRPGKELGQNFLIDLDVVSDLIDASEPKAGDVYLEIGPGQGAVTRILAPKAKKVVAVEFDRELIPKLNENLRNLDNIEVISNDILSFICSDVLIHRYNFNKIIGSIPYQITSPLLHELVNLSQKTRIDAIILLIQKEVAQKISAQPPDASYLSNFVQTYFDVKIVRNVSREGFRPKPKVDGAIVTLRPKPEGLTEKTLRVNPGPWSQFLHTAFKFPRKMLRRVFDEKMLKESGIGPGQRPQEIELGQWLSLYQIYDRQKIQISSF